MYNYKTRSIGILALLRIAAQLISKHWFTAILIYLGAHLVFKKDVSVQFEMDPARYERANSRNGDYQGGATHASLVPAVNVSDLSKSRNKKLKEASAKIGNLTPILSPEYSRRHRIDPAIIREKVRICQAYVDRYANVAIKEQEQYGIPASITLAQGLLESNAGSSQLAMESNNHFGIKCRSKCRGCTCRNYSDDDVYDMFRVFDSAWDSFREHSVLLSSPRYAHLLDLESTDYKNWARGLKKAGYATDPTYAEKLIQIIDYLDLYQYDR